ncbi:MAG: class I SAM-dependent methyltransferase [Cytophagales bacterium]|nr:class I SAM-dependent methyltransferase [Cytophagales bacterium]MDW8384693.1 class I SAM-dependent methyltransferase [Flammeovirgaceae bacterium]
MTLSGEMPSVSEGNYEFYRRIQIPIFQHYAKLTGMDTGKDIDIIYPMIEKSTLVVELGAGYGRSVQFLLQKGFCGRLVLVERVPEMIEYLKQAFPPLEILQTDIRYLQLPFQADVLLWLWSGILELSRQEQTQTVQQLYKNLKKGGLLFIEAPYQRIQVVGSHTSEKLIKLETEWGTLTAYLPSPEEVESDARLAGFSSFKKILYRSQTDLERVIYLLTK